MRKRKLKRQGRRTTVPGETGLDAELAELPRKQAKRLLERAAEKLMEDWGERIKVALNAIVDQRVKVARENLQGLVDEEFDKRVMRRVDSILNTEVELRKIDFNTPFTELTDMMKDGWRVMSMVAPSSLPESMKHTAGIVLQRLKPTKKHNPAVAEDLTQRSKKKGRRST